MRYLYLNAITKTVTVCNIDSDRHGELLGSSTVWEQAKPKTRTFIVASLIQNSKHRGMTGIKIVDCERLQPSENIEP